jgi:hypothetical protein
MRRNLYIPEAVYRDMQMVAKSNGLSLSKFLIGLYVEHRKGVIIPLPEVGPGSVIVEGSDIILHESVFVDSEELDRNPDKYPHGTIGITPPDKAIKKPLIVNIEEPKVGGTDRSWDTKQQYPKSRSVDPGGTGKKSKMK